MYRRALAPMTMLAGVLGLVAATFGWFAKLDQPVVFITYWAVAAGIVNAAALVLVRKQAVGDMKAGFMLLLAVIGMVVAVTL